MRDVTIAITAASYSGNKGAAAMLESAIIQLHKKYGDSLNINLMSVYPSEDRKQIPFDFIKVIASKPEIIIFLAFPLAILYKVFGFIPGVKKLLGKFKIIGAYRNTDLCLDMAGISFVDSRGFIMNTYAFICCAIPMLIGVPVIKYSQAMGPFKNIFNRIESKIILKKCKLVIARGEITRDNLKSIGISDNVELCADGAFTMPDNEMSEKIVKRKTLQDVFYRNGNITGISLSSVVNKKCYNNGIDYITEMASFINALNDSGRKVLIIANAARINSKKPRNNDLFVCDSVYNLIVRKDMVRWYHEEMTAEVIREFIGLCDNIVASRFHTMIGALQRKKPVLLIGWSHKYKEVLDMFGLGSYAYDFADFSAEGLLKTFNEFTKSDVTENIISNIEKHYDDVIKSSYRNIELVGEYIEEHIIKPSTALKKRYKLLDLSVPEKYIGEFISCKKGYAVKENIRNKAASGGMVTAILCEMLDAGHIDGAWVSKTAFKDEKVTYETFIATNKEEIKECSSSIYMDIPMMKHLDMVRAFKGRIAVVLTPCMMNAYNKILEQDEELKQKTVLKLGLFCSGCHYSVLTDMALRKSGVSTDKATRLYYRTGHWRGRSAVIYSDKYQKTFSYTKSICAYKNAYFFEKNKCMSCRDQFNSGADLSFGDIWLKSMKKNPIKHTQCIIRNEKAYRYFNEAVDRNYICSSHLSASDALKSQKRALVFKFNTLESNRLNYRLARSLAEKNRLLSIQNPQKVEKIPLAILYLYMCFIRFLLSF